jgi:hypothetical protein
MIVTKSCPQGAFFSALVFLLALAMTFTVVGEKTVALAAEAL